MVDPHHLGMRCRRQIAVAERANRRSLSRRKNSPLPSVTITVLVADATKTLIVTLGKGEFFGEIAMIDGSVAFGDRDAAAPKTKGDANKSCPVRLSRQPAAGVRADDHGCAPSGCAPRTRHVPNRGQDERPQTDPVLDILNSDGCTLIKAAKDVYQIRFKNRAANAYLVRGA